MDPQTDRWKDLQTNKSTLASEHTFWKVVTGRLTVLLVRPHQVTALCVIWELIPMMSYRNLRTV